MRPLLYLALVGVLGIFFWSFLTGLANPLHSANEAAEKVAPVLQPGTEGMGKIRVEVLNGSGIQGAARAATQRLRDWGFDVVYIGNADSFDYDSTVIRLRAGEENAAASVGAALGIDTVENQPDTSLALEVTVILGADWVPGH